MSSFNKTWALDAGERAVKTVAQSMVAMLSAGAIGLLDVNYVALMSVSGLAGLVSLLTSVASAQTGDGSASLVVETKEKK